MSQIDDLNEKSNDSTSFRQCHHSDLSRVQKLVLQLYETDPGEYPVRPEIEKTFSEFDSHPEKGKIIVFERDGEIVGYAILVFFWSNEFGGDIIEIDEILIERKYRRLGIGKKFFSWLDNEYSKCCGYALQTTEHNESAIALYKSIGFRASRNEYFIKLKNS
ncbi:MAG: GNAT family N-acetyltransferase [Leptolyngbya sp.]|nr:GNAT family N-acetyltransferase [Candidatus Melainabacteria bacterium]